MPQFINEHFFTIWLISMAWPVGLVSWLFWRRHQRGAIFPEVPPQQIRFKERFASGWSHKNWRTRWLGAQNGLKIIVTDEELWVVPVFPFSALAELTDLEHRVRKDDITRVTERRHFFVRSFLIDFLDQEGQSHRVDLRPRRWRQFKAALGYVGISTE
ncbi:MAG: hypothetical protein O7G29_04690 [Acidobacteria bacterium]|nr:hypothetical protein [Acidobacteriota bacterium]